MGKRSFWCLLALAYAIPLLAENRAIQNKVVLQNSEVRFEFEGGHQGLSALVDRASGLNHIHPTDGGQHLWALRFHDKKETVSLSNTDSPCESASLERAPGGAQRAVFMWRGLDLPGEKDVIHVRVSVELSPESGLAYWRIWVENDSTRWGLWEVDFPRCSGFLRAGQYDVACPRRNWGKLYKKCRERLSWEYPRGWSMPMQFLCAIKGAHAVYMATHDPQAWYKWFSLEPGREFTVKTYPKDMAVPGSDFLNPFPAILGVYQGDWLTGCKIYRKFALTAPWTSQGRLSQRPSVPQALKNVALWMHIERTIGPPGGTLEEKNKPLVDAQKYFEVPIAAHWYNWHKIPFDAFYPHYFPTKPGIPQQARDLVSRGLIMMPYINGRIVDVLNEDFEKYLPFSTKDLRGKYYVEIYGNGRKQTPMCAYTEFWQNEVTEIVDRLAREVGVNAVYIDQIAAAQPRLCFDKSHGHPLGGGGWWVDAYREMLKKIQGVAHAQGRDVIITTECAAEPFMDGLDAFLLWIKPDPRSIPMITAVYSGYSIYFGSPAWFEHGDRAWIASQGRAFIWGTQNGWMGLELFKPEHTQKAAYLKKIGQYRVAARKFLTFGELVDVIRPENEIPSITENWPDQGNRSRRVTLPSLQGAVWKAEDDSLGVFLVNYLEKNNPVSFTLNPAKYGLDTSRGFRVTQIRPGKNALLSPQASGRITRTEKLGSREIRMLMFVPGLAGDSP